jgi:hypothetical protein
MTRYLSFVSRPTVLMVAVIVTIVLVPRGAAADQIYWDEVTDNAAIALDTLLGNLTARQEKEMIGDNWFRSKEKRRQAGRTSIGQVGIDGFFPVVGYAPPDLGQAETLTFFFIDPATDQRTSPAFAVSAVSYYALLDPSNLVGQQLTEAVIRQNLTLIGTTGDATNDFAVGFVLTGFEPLILGFPLDALGNEIEGEGTAAYAAHVLVPEPSTFLLLGVGALAYGWRRRVSGLNVKYSDHGCRN